MLEAIRIMQKTPEFAIRANFDDVYQTAEYKQRYHRKTTMTHSQTKQYHAYIKPRIIEMIKEKKTIKVIIEETKITESFLSKCKLELKTEI